MTKNYGSLHSERIGIITKNSVFLEFFINLNEFNIDFLGAEKINYDLLKPNYNKLNEMVSISFNAKKNITIQPKQAIFPSKIKEFSKKMFSKL